MTRYTVDLRQSSTQLLFTTVCLEGICRDGAVSVGTAFFFNAADSAGEPRVYLITNNHVLEGCVSVHLKVHVVSSTQEPSHFCGATGKLLTIEAPNEVWVPHPDPSIDLCGAPLPSLLERTGPVPNLYYTTLSSAHIPSPEEESRFPAIMQIAMIGYPTGISDKANNLPLIRRGTTASHPSVDYDGRREVVVDMACFPGSSGSPVVFHDFQYFASTIRFLGVLYAGPTFSLDGDIVRRKIPTRSDPAVRVESMIHLGYVIKASKVRELAKFIENMA